MRSNLKTVFALSAMCLAFGLTSCNNKGCTDNTATNYDAEAKKDDGSCEYADTNKFNYFIGLRAMGAGDETADYALMTSSLKSGNISSTGEGVEQTGWCYFLKAGDIYFTFNYSLNEAIAYTIDDDLISEKGKFVFERMDLNTTIDDNTIFSIGAPWGGGSFDCNFQLIDVNDVSIASSVKHPIYTSFAGDSANTKLNAWPTGAYVDGNKLYVSFYKVVGETFATPKTDTAFVSVYSYPSMSYITTFKDSRTSAIGYYGDSPAILEDENGNHYTLSSSSFGAGYTQATKPSGILKINAGESKFDENYFYNFEEATGYKLLTGTYVANGKAVVRYIPQDGPDYLWAAFQDNVPFTKIGVIDLVNKTFTEVADIPAHGGQYKTPFYIENGLVYVSVNTGSEAHIYSVDANTATAKKGAAIDGLEAQAIYKID